ncbi:MAG: GntG family PLP-dependent aldolase [Bacteroidota bacterium]
MEIDLRSDTLTKPTPGMLAAMMSAEVGDDVYREDPTVNQLEAYGADLFGKEAALYCPSGTMTNQIAIRVLTQPQDQVICYRHAHVYLYEGGGMAYNSMVTARTIEAPRGLLSAEQILAQINPDDIHFPRTSLVCLENTVNKGGGSCYDLEQVAEIREVCNENGLSLHLDGARVFNAIVAKGYSPAELGQYFDTMSVCLSKGLGAPVGSLLIGNAARIKAARRVRKVFGGGMRQAGFLAAAGLYALQHQVKRLAEDHIKAERIGSLLHSLPWVKSVYPVETNIVIFEPERPVEQVLQQFEALGIKAAPFGPTLIRMVTHLDITQEMMSELLGRLEQIALPVS